MTITCAGYTRRAFLARIGAAVAVAAAGGYGISVWGRDPDRAIAAPFPGEFGTGGDRTLVVLEMGGGNDGLNMVVPHSSGRYHDLRKDLAIGDPIDLDGDIGLHPALGFVASQYREGNVAVVEGVGYPDPDLSHFASMAAWWSAAAGGDPSASGWLGRYLDGTVGTNDPLAGVTIGPGPSPAMLGERSFVVAVQDMSGLAPRVPAWIDDTDELLAMWRGFAPAAFDDASLLDEVRRAIAGTVDAAATLNSTLAAASEEAPTTPEADGDGVDRRRPDALGTAMEVAAALVTSPARPRAIVVHGWGDFDTHESQQRRHGEMMETLDAALEAFFASVRRGGAGGEVVVMTTSEFGRRVAFNGSGTDHGTAAAHLVLGDPVDGGRYGEPPDLGSLDTRGNLVHTVDYRSLYATVLDGWLGAPAPEILRADYELLPIFAQTPRRTMLQA